uniref:Uncharacterized protein n=1 Tax=Trichuris muris TaxID=70415 RepID=A0A5S6Q6C2_TRIMR
MSDPNNHEEIWRAVRLLGSIHLPAEKMIEALQCFSDHYEAMLNKCWSIPGLRELHSKLELLLDTISPAFVVNNQRQRHVLLMIERLTISDTCIYDWGSVARVLVKVSLMDNVENGTLALKIFRTCIAKVYKKITDQVPQLIHTFKDIYNQLPQKLPVFVKACGRICENDDDEENFIHQIILPNLGTNIRVYRKSTSEGEGKPHLIEFLWVRTVSKRIFNVCGVLPKNRLSIRGATDLTTTVLAIFHTDRKLLCA